jgi:hypothetical protein
MNLYTLSRRATSTTHPSLLHTSFAFTKPQIIAKIPMSSKKFTALRPFLLRKLP